MIKNKTVAVVVPAYNEEKQIGMVIDTMPNFVDRIIIVNDKSKDRTEDVVKDYINKSSKSEILLTPFPSIIEDNIYNLADKIVRERDIDEIKYYKPSKIVNDEPDRDRIILINNLENGGVGASIARGYKWCKDHEIDCVAVMAGDGQMDPNELLSICLPVIDENIDYVKGNRLIHPSAKYLIPKTRFIGNSVLSMLTKIASGYWRVSDTQTGYTAISKSALRKIQIYKIYRSYGMPNDLLVKLNINNCSLKEIEIKPVYRIGEQSKMKIFKVIPRISFLLTKCFFRRIWIKYFVRDFHPLFLFYLSSFVLGIIAIPYLFKIISAIFNGLVVNNEPLFAFVFLSISSIQFLIFAMWMDIIDNERLYK